MMEIQFFIIYFFSEEEAYVCLKMRQRSENVLEFKIGIISSPIYLKHLCEDPHMDQSHWMTQAREFS